MPSPAPLTLYTADTCPWCVKVKQFLAARNIPWTERNIDHDRAIHAEVIALTGQKRVPVLQRGDAYVIGYDEPAILQLAEQT